MIREQLLQAHLIKMQLVNEICCRFAGCLVLLLLLLLFWEWTFLRALLNCSGFNVLTVVSVKSNSFWVVTPCNLVEDYRHLGGMHCLHYKQSLLAACFFLVTSLAYSLTLKIEVVCSFKTLMNFYQTTQSHILEDSTVINCSERKVILILRTIWYWKAKRNKLGKAHAWFPDVFFTVFHN
jgi:hypothetical protein